MDYFLMGLAVCVIIALICWYISYNNRRKNHKKIVAPPQLDATNFYL